MVNEITLSYTVIKSKTSVDGLSLKTSIPPKVIPIITETKAEGKGRALSSFVRRCLALSKRIKEGAKVWRTEPTTK